MVLTANGPFYERMNELVDAFERDWTPGRALGIAEYMEQASEKDETRRRELFSRLLEIDALLGAARNAELPKEYYLERFPQYRDVVGEILGGLSELAQEEIEKASEEEEFPVAREFEHYRLERFLGRGVTGSVYLGTDMKMRRSVAFKFLDPEQNDEEAFQQFKTEVECNGQIDDEHVVRAYSYGLADGRPYLITEYVDGIDLERYVLSHPDGRLDVDETLEIAIQIAQGLKSLHAANLVHRDIKPGNIMRRTSDGLIKLADLGFGVSFDNDEDLKAKAASSQTDVRALGAVVFFMLSGRSLIASIDRSISVQSLHAFFHENGISVPRRLLKAIFRMTSDQSGARISTSNAALKELEACAAPKRRATATELLSLGFVGGFLLCFLTAETLWNKHAEPIPPTEQSATDAPHATQQASSEEIPDEPAVLEPLDEQTLEKLPKEHVD